MKTIILTGGGTAGHIIPNLALVPELRKYFDSIHYFGGNGMEENLVTNAGIPFHKTTVVKFDRSKIFSNLKIPFLLQKGINEAKELITFIKPDVVFSKGGYAALPVCFAAKKLGIPVVCHESDYTLGLANKIVSSFAAKTLTSFPETKGGIYVGSPVREEFYSKKPSYCEVPNMDARKKTLLVCGGSLGSSAINNVIYSVLPVLLKNYNVIHISGKTGDFNVKRNNYYQCSYAPDFPALMRRADLVICRAGSNTLFEAAATGIRCIAIPLPKGASRGDQILNAKSFEKHGYCEVLPQEKLCPETLLSKIEAIWHKTPQVLDVLQINEKIVKHILSVI